MINNTDSNSNNNAPQFSVKRAGKKKATKRISCPKQAAFNGRKVNLGMAYGKSVHGVISCAVPGDLYKQVVMVAKQEKINVSDFVRRGIIREIGATLLCRNMGLNPEIYGAAGLTSQPKAKKEAPDVDRKTKVAARAAIRDLRKALKRLAD